MSESLPAGASIFLDANVLIYHALDGRASCAMLLRQALTGEVRAVTSTHVLGEVLHRLTLAEVVTQRNLPSARAALNHLRRHPAHLAALHQAPRFLAAVPTPGVRVVPVHWRHVTAAADLSRRHGLLTNDALIVAVMRAHHLTRLATNDADFERVPGLSLWRP